MKEDSPAAAPGREPGILRLELFGGREEPVEVAGGRQAEVLFLHRGVGGAEVRSQSARPSPQHVKCSCIKCRYGGCNDCRAEA